jgi:hypothetical protein
MSLEPGHTGVAVLAVVVHSVTATTRTRTRTRTSTRRRRPRRTTRNEGDGKRACVFSDPRDGYCG